MDKINISGIKQYAVNILTHELPSEFLSADFIRPTLVHFALNTLACLENGIPSIPREKRHAIATWLGLQLTPFLSTEVQNAISLRIQDGTNEQVEGTLDFNTRIEALSVANMYAVVSSLIVLWHYEHKEIPQDPESITFPSHPASTILKSIDRTLVHSWLLRLQSMECFSASSDDAMFTVSSSLSCLGETDARFLYSSVVLSRLLKLRTVLTSDVSSRQLNASYSKSTEVLFDPTKLLHTASIHATHEGGFSLYPGGEAHGGSTYCTIASLDLSGVPLIPSGGQLQAHSLTELSTMCGTKPIDVSSQQRWLASRQFFCTSHSQNGSLHPGDPRNDDSVPRDSVESLFHQFFPSGSRGSKRSVGTDASTSPHTCNDEMCGGLSGRTGKISDSCYSFWIGASVQILINQCTCANVSTDMTRDTPTSTHANETHSCLCQLSYESNALANYILRCQFPLEAMGGFARDPESYPDPFHTFYSIAGLSLLYHRPDAPSEPWRSGSSIHLEEIEPSFGMAKYIVDAWLAT